MSKRFTPDYVLEIRERMKTLRAQYPGAVMPHIAEIQPEIERLVSRVLTENDLSATPVDMATLIENLDFDLFRFDLPSAVAESMGDTRGAMWDSAEKDETVGSNRFILINSSEDGIGTNSVAAHELSHFFTDDKEWVACGVGDGDIASLPESEQWIEVFRRTLQMPKTFVASFFTTLNVGDVTWGSVVKTLAEFFRMSNHAAWWRTETLLGHKIDSENAPFTPRDREQIITA